MLKTSERQRLIQKIKDDVVTTYGGKLAGIVLYGSFARGDFNEDSDMDFLIVLDKIKLDYGAEIRQLVKITHPLMLKYNIVVSCLPISFDRWKNEKSFFLDNLKKDGIEVWTRKSAAS